MRTTSIIALMMEAVRTFETPVFQRDYAALCPRKSNLQYKSARYI
jgi:hypothetical protein